MTTGIRGKIAGTIDYTDVRKDVTYADIERICLEAAVYRLGAVVVPSALVRRAADCLASTDVAVSCYVGYPFGTQAVAVKAREAEIAVEHGATELEVVLHHGAARAARWTEVEAELAAVRSAAGPVLLKLVAETSILSDDELSSIARLAAGAGYAMLANTAGFRIVSTRPETQSAASSQAIERLVRSGDGRIRPKATGGVRTYEDIVRVVAAGAARVALDAAPDLLRRLAENSREEE